MPTARRPRHRALLFAAALLPLASPAGPALAGDAPATGLVADPCAGVIVQPSEEMRSHEGWYEKWIGAWLATDWAQRCRYRAENAQLPPAGPRRVVLVGDSITEGWREQVPGYFNARMLDRGISGQVTEQMLLRLREDAIALAPAAVQLMAGTNDIAGNRGPTTLGTIEGNIASMAELLRAHHIRVLIASVPPAKGFGWQPAARPANDIRQLNDWLRAYAARERFTWVDYWSALADGEGGMKPEYSGDGVHPNAAGYAVMQPILDAALQRALAAPERHHR